MKPFYSKGQVNYSMWVEKRKDKYLAVERYKDYMTGKTKRVSVIMERDTKQERNKAQRILLAKIEAMQAPEVKASSYSIHDLKEAYIRYQKQLLKASTTHRNENILNIVTKIIGQDVLCDRLTASYIMDRLLSTQKSNVTINTYLTRLKAMLRWGYKNDLCPDIASKLSLLPDKSEREKIADKFLEKDELKKILDGMKVEQWKMLTQFLALSGLRIGEAFALEYADIDLKERLIHVTKTYAPIVKQVTPPKTTDSIRDVYMQDELLSICRKLLAKAKRNALELGYQSSLVFCDIDGNYINYDVYEKYLRENGQAILGRKITSHVMRHTMTSLFSEAGVDLAVIARRLGHHDSKLTRDIYLHCTKTQREKDNETVRQISIL